MNGQSGVRRFVVTSQGVSATRWLAFVLASHPRVFVAHGHFPVDSVVGGDFQQEKSKGDAEALSIGNAHRELYDANKIGEVFKVYQSLRPDAEAYGNVHSYTLDDLMQRHFGDAGNPPEFAVANLVRHPVSYVESHFALVRKAERHPAVYYTYASDLLPKALGEFPELFLVDCPDFREFLAFATSCYSALNVARDLGYEQVRHLPMESLTMDVETLAEFCRSLAGLNYSLEKLNSFIAAGAINRHRKDGAIAEPWSTYRAWSDWKRNVAAIMFSESALARFERVAYDVGMLRDGMGKAERERPSAPCLADALKAMDFDHPLLALRPSGAANTANIAAFSSPPPRRDGILVWSLRHPRKTFVGLLAWLSNRLRRLGRSG